ncbi:cytochrome c3 family protein [uncultured Ferrimonas sp.]|uniref:cytochrome c3 family protein n=1 Tax=uncultured Ferrimonas sp. TaxID=432640 RepID=UPI0026136877|nr:cytochrome c3 family protein [uncultured Ferrimonas sp.]
MKKLLTLAAVLSLAFGAQAADLQASDSLVKMGPKLGRDYHQMNYDMGCDSCHDNGLRVRPSDQACDSCHDIDELAKVTARAGDEVLQNPHNNLHYGKEVPCTECHGEHQAKPPMCNSCHTFKFAEHKQ